MRKPNFIRPLKSALRLLRHTIGALAVLAFVYAVGGLRADHSLTRIAHPSLAPSPSMTPNPSQSNGPVALSTPDDLRPGRRGPAVASTGTSKPGAHKTPPGDIAVAFTPAPASAPAPTPAPPVRTGGVAVAPAVARTGGYIITSRARLATLPVTGAAWQGLKAAADRPAGTPDLSNQDQDNNVLVLAKAFVYARTGELRYRDEVI
nr:hypothetical protein [Chloroflexota bacterium]